MSDEVSGNGLDVTIREFVAGQKIFQRYTLVRVLGRGGMGVVWLARDNELEREVALKFLPEMIIHDRAVLSDLKRETRRSLELTHKNIVRIYDFVHDQTSGCISMEYVDGDTLSNLRADKPHKVFEPSELKEWVSQLCDALDYAHNHARIVHRDLKPANLMVNQRADLKVSDFGIARSLSDSVSKLTMEHGKSGTLVYMSPQQLDGEHGSHLDDIYSFGATIYELLTSKPPFYSGNIDRQIHEKIPPPMSRRREDLEIEGEPIDETWEKLVAACLQKDPARRPQSVIEIANLVTVPLLRRSAPSSHKTRPETEVPQTKPVGEKRLRAAAVKAIAAGKERIRDLAVGIGAAAQKSAFAQHDLPAFQRAGRAVVAASKTALRVAGATLLAMIVETVRGIALTILPAVAVAACVWYLAIRTPPPKKIAEQPLPKVQPSEQPIPPPIDTRVAKAGQTAQPATPASPESKPPATWPFRPRPTPIYFPVLPPANLALKGGLQVIADPPAAAVIVDGSIIETSPATGSATVSDLPVGKHQLQIVLEGYVTEETEVDVREGQFTDLGIITLHRRTQPPTTAEPPATQTPSIFMEKALPVTMMAPSDRNNRTWQAWIGEFVRQFVSANQLQDVNANLAFYAPDVHYFDEQRRDQAYIRRDIEKYNERWPIRHDSIEGDIHLQEKVPDQEYVASFKLNFYAESAARAVWTKGQFAIDLDISIIDGIPSISGIKEKTLHQQKGKPNPAMPNSRTPANLPRYPYGIPVSGKPGFVKSPYALSKGFIDLRRYRKGAEVKCPFTGKIFIAP